jgi:hypothetical protein
MLIWERLTLLESLFVLMSISDMTTDNCILLRKQKQLLFVTNALKLHFIWTLDLFVVHESNHFSDDYTCLTLSLSTVISGLYRLTNFLLLISCFYAVLYSLRWVSFMKVITFRKRSSLLLIVTVWLKELDLSFTLSYITEGDIIFTKLPAKFEICIGRFITRLFSSFQLLSRFFMCNAIDEHCTKVSGPEEILHIVK